MTVSAQKKSYAYPGATVSAGLLRTPLFLCMLSFLSCECGRQRQPGKAVPGISGVTRVRHRAEHALDNSLPMH